MGGGRSKSLGKAAARREADGGRGRERQLIKTREVFFLLLFSLFPPEQKAGQIPPGGVDQKATKSVEGERQSLVCELATISCLDGCRPALVRHPRARLMRGSLESGRCNGLRLRWVRSSCSRQACCCRTCRKGRGDWGARHVLRPWPGRRGTARLAGRLVVIASCIGLVGKTAGRCRVCCYCVSLSDKTAGRCRERESLKLHQGSVHGALRRHKAAGLVN